MRAAALVLACVALTACARLPEGERTRSSALDAGSESRLGRALAPAIKANPGKSGVYALPDGRDAFAARVLLARFAERSLDVQYYIWRGDITGGLLYEALWQAAERGVRVRLLLDDNNTGGLDEALAALDAHANIEVRLFNPYVSRRFRFADLASDFSRLNRRMHNKSYTADGQVTIVGGRNVGDEYFGGESPVEFADLDAMAVGAVVREVSIEFDAYWNSASAYPVSMLLAAPRPDSAERVRAAWAKLNDDPRAARYLETLRATPLVKQLVAGDMPLEWAPARVVGDDPSKVLHPPERRDLHMLQKLDAALGMPRHEFDVVSPYFVPTEDGTATLVALAQRGIRVRVLTNSLAATDVAPVHAGYAKYREALLRGGVRLHELKPSARVEGSGREMHGGGSEASLHAKTFAVDRARIFVGSFNFDPRSARLNTEMGIVVDSPSLAARLSQALDRDLTRNAYEVRLASGKLEWLDGETRHASEPNTGLFRRAWIGVLSILPIEWLL